MKLTFFLPDAESEDLGQTICAIEQGDGVLVGFVASGYFGTRESCVLLTLTAGPDQTQNNVEIAIPRSQWETLVAAVTAGQGVWSFGSTDRVTFAPDTTVVPIAQTPCLEMTTDYELASCMLLVNSLESFPGRVTSASVAFFSDSSAAFDTDVFNDLWYWLVREN